MEKLTKRELTIILMILDLLGKPATPELLKQQFQHWSDYLVSRPI
jgi:hypothetical protein